MSARLDRSTPGIPTFEPPYFGTLGRRCSYSGLSPSASNCRLLLPKIPFPAARFRATKGRLTVRKFGIPRGKKRRFEPGRNYRGFNPSSSNCRLHSAGASRSRSTPMPRSKRPSTAALTRSGARKASEILALSHRTLQKWRARGIGPTFMKFSRTFRYPVAELVVWTEQNRATPLDRSISEKR